MVMIVGRKSVDYLVPYTFQQFGFIASASIYHPLGKHAPITPSASTSVTSERESGVGGVALDDGGGGGTRSKHQSNDSSKTASGSDRGRGMSPISSTDPQPNKGAALNNSRGGGRKWGATKSAKESSSVASRGSSSSTSTTASNDPHHHQGGSLNSPHPHIRGDSVTSPSHRNSTPPPTSTSQPNSTRLSHQPPVSSSSAVSGKRGEGSVSKELPPSGKTQQQVSSASRGKGNQSRLVG